jgi:hypothetical protein
MTTELELASVPNPVAVSKYDALACMKMSVPAGANACKGAGRKQRAKMKHSNLVNIVSLSDILSILCPQNFLPLHRATSPYPSL